MRVYFVFLNCRRFSSSPVEVKYSIGLKNDYYDVSEVNSPTVKNLQSAADSVMPGLKVSFEPTSTGSTGTGSNSSSSQVCHLLKKFFQVFNNYPISGRFKRDNRCCSWWSCSLTHNHNHSGMHLLQKVSVYISTLVTHIH